MQSKPSTSRRDKIQLNFYTLVLKKEDASTGMIKGPHERFNDDENVHNLLISRVNIIKELKIFVYTRHTIMQALIQRTREVCRHKLILLQLNILSIEDITGTIMAHLDCEKWAGDY